jgi:hypothetical protein
MRGRALRLIVVALAVVLLASATQAHAAPGDRTRRRAEQRGGLFEDIPVSGALVALGLAALIGAAGGFVYAGIMGPKR